MDFFRQGIEKADWLTLALNEPIFSPAVSKWNRESTKLVCISTKSKCILYFFESSFYFFASLICLYPINKTFFSYDGAMRLTWSINFIHVGPFKHLNEKIKTNFGHKQYYLLLFISQVRRDEILQSKRYKYQFFWWSERCQVLMLFNNFIKVEYQWDVMRQNLLNSWHIEK